jgi:hypothetical protein
MLDGQLSIMVEAYDRASVVDEGSVGGVQSVETEGGRECLPVR